VRVSGFLRIYFNAFIFGSICRGVDNTYTLKCIALFLARTQIYELFIDIKYQQQIETTSTTADSKSLTLAAV